MSDITTWFDEVRTAAACRVVPSRLSRSTAWRWREGMLAHDSGGFFAVAGVEWMSPDGSRRRQPLLDQRHVGILGFLTRRRDGVRELLVHAKLEPGNVGLVQVAPTCQATDSNVRRLHGGAAPPYATHFVNGQEPVLYDTPQSEQGTRFFHKRNRNVLVETDEDMAPGVTHRWMPTDEVLSLLSADHTVNTDARSVLVCAPWSALVSRTPFSRPDEPFGRDLLRSSQEGSRPRPLEDVIADVLTTRAQVEDATLVPLHTLDGWTIDDEGIHPSAPGGFAIRQIDVRVHGREVEAWDQPIVDSGGEGHVDLICGRIDGVLHFHFAVAVEPGLVEGAELTASYVVEPGDPAPPRTWPGTVVASCRQSDEGGRFFRDVNRYRVIDIGQASAVALEGHWITLRDVRRLLDVPGWLTNEARSALSLLLPWL